MRVAVVAGEYPSARAPERAMYVRDQVDALRAAGHDVSVVHHDPPTLRRLVSAARRRLAERRASPSPSPSPEATAPGPSAAAASPAPPAAATAAARLRTLGRVVHDRVGQGIAEVAMVRDLARLDPLPDVVHAHNVFPAGAAAVRFARRRGVPVVVTEHSSAFRRGQYDTTEVRRAARIYRRCAAVVAVSPSQAESLPVGGVVVVGNVVPEGFRLRRGDAAADGDVVSIGTLMAHKGMDALIRAYALLPAHVRGRHGLVLVGDGPDGPRLRALAAALGVTDRVRFAGHVPRTRVAEILTDAAVLVSASPVETFGVTLVEGLSAGVPFVAVRSGGPESVWFPGAGVLVDTSEPTDLAAGIERVLAGGEESAGHEGHKNPGGRDDGEPVPQGPSADARRRAQAHERFGGNAVAARLSARYREAAAGRDDRTAR